jgi:hypothetical protein
MACKNRNILLLLDQCDTQTIDDHVEKDVDTPDIKQEEEKREKDMLSLSPCVLQLSCTVIRSTDANNKIVKAMDTVQFPRCIRTLKSQEL